MRTGTTDTNTTTTTSTVIITTTITTTYAAITYITIPTSDQDVPTSIAHMIQNDDNDNNEELVSSSFSNIFIDKVAEAIARGITNANTKTKTKRKYENDDDSLMQKKKVEVPSSSSAIIDIFEDAGRYVPYGVDDDTNTNAVNNTNNAITAVNDTTVLSMGLFGNDDNDTNTKEDRMAPVVAILQAQAKREEAQIRVTELAAEGMVIEESKIHRSVFAGKYHFYFYFYYYFFFYHHHYYCYYTTNDTNINTTTTIKGRKLRKLLALQLVMVPTKMV